jgi:thiol-disulfide isomerase/thioredoxin
MTTNLPDTPNPNRWRNLLIAGVAIVLAALFALSLKVQTSGTSLVAMAKAATPLDGALTNGKPTLMEFYADWCTSCQAMAPQLADLKQEYGDRVNFAMLNVDNEKWLPEIVAYRVDGIPHFVYLDQTGQPQSQAIGEQPRSLMAESLLALADGKDLTQAITTGQTTPYQAPTATDNVNSKPRPDDPRAHGSQVKG